MSQDISKILQQWPFDPHELSVRRVTGADGVVQIQMRLELGILQFYAEGRPDGQKPHDLESLLDYHEQCAQGREEEYRLTAEEVEGLYREGQQYYKRYLSLFHLEWYEPMIRDTERNLRLIAFVRRHASKKRERRRFDQFRPYVLMMDARGRGMLALRRNDRASALEEINRGITRITEFLAEYGRSAEDTELVDLEFLKRWAEELVAEAAAAPDVDENELDGLRSKLRQAIDSEDYEQAADLRDRIRRLEHSPPAND